MRKFFKWLLIGMILIVLVVWAVTLNAGPKAKKIVYGVTFSAPYAESLGLNWQATYMDMLKTLQVKNLRLSAYWDATEPQQNVYNFSDLDFQVNNAAAYNAKIVLAVGRRLPRWPECHDPGWISGLTQDQLQQAQLSYITAVVNRYKNNPAITEWQVENEPFLSSFGICPPLNVSFFDSEVALVKKLDPTRPILITDSGELDWWFSASARGDIFGTTFYRYVYSDVLHRYWSNFYFFPWVYRFKAGIIRLVHPGKPIEISELEAEPWTTAGIPNTSISDQFQTMSLAHFNTITHLAAETGFSPQYLWGVEWWEWMKQHGHPEFWAAASKLINN